MSYVTATNATTSVLSIQGVGALKPGGTRTWEVDDDRITATTAELDAWVAKGKLSYSTSSTPPAPDDFNRHAKIRAHGYAMQAGDYTADAAEVQTDTDMDA